MFDFYMGVFIIGPVANLLTKLASIFILPFSFTGLAYENSKARGLSPLESVARSLAMTLAASPIILFFSISKFIWSCSLLPGCANALEEMDIDEKKSWSCVRSAMSVPVKELFESMHNFNSLLYRWFPPQFIQPSNSLVLSIKPKFPTSTKEIKSILKRRPNDNPPLVEHVQKYPQEDSYKRRFSFNFDSLEDSLLPYHEEIQDEKISIGSLDTEKSREELKTNQKRVTFEETAQLRRIYF